MKNRKLLLAAALLALLTSQTFGKTVVTPYMEVESNTYKNDTQLKDAVTLGLAVTQSITDKTSLSLDLKTTDYDFIGHTNTTSDKTGASSRERAVIYLNNQILKMDNGAILTLGLGTQLDTSTVGGSKAISYRVRPMLTYPVNKDLTVTGDWLFTKDKTDKTGAIGDYYSTYELLTGVKYTGITNAAITLQLYNYAKSNLTSGDKTGETETQLRGSVSSKFAGVTVTPWLRVDLGKYKFTDKAGNAVATSEKSRNRYGIDLSKTINNVSYGTSLYVQPTDYSDSTKIDETQQYVKVSATYIF